MEAELLVAIMNAGRRMRIAPGTPPMLFLQDKSLRYLAETLSLQIAKESRCIEGTDEETIRAYVALGTRMPVHIWTGPNGVAAWKAR